MSMAEIASSSSSAEDHTDANKKTSIAGDLFCLSFLILPGLLLFLLILGLLFEQMR